VSRRVIPAAVAPQAQQHADLTSPERAAADRPWRGALVSDASAPAAGGGMSARLGASAARMGEEEELDAAAAAAAPDLVSGAPTAPRGLDDAVRASLTEHRAHLASLVVSLRGEVSLLQRAEEAARAGLLGRAALDAYLREASEKAAARAVADERRALRARAWEGVAKRAAWPAHEAPPVVVLPPSELEPPPQQYDAALSPGAGSSVGSGPALL